MGFRVNALAERDLAEIGDFIARDSMDRALSFVSEIETRFAEIACQPQLYRMRDELLPGLRAAAHGRYLIYFRRADDGEIEFLRVLHGARDQTAALGLD